MDRWLDLAYYPGVQLAQVARANKVAAIAGYVYDPFVADSGGYVGGWTPDVIGALEALGLTFIPIFTMQPASGLVLTPDRCLQVLQAVPRNTGLVAIDVETGSDPGTAYLQGWVPAMKQGGFRPIEYGSVSTLQRDSGTGAYKWVADYIRSGWDDSLTPAPGADAWQFAGSVNIDGVTADLTNSNIPLGGTSVATIDDVYALLQQIDQRTGQVWNELMWGTNVGGQVPQGWLATQIVALQKSIAAIPGTPDNTAALAAIQASLSKIEAAMVASGKAEEGA
jgi:hypothetical protein